MGLDLYAGSLTRYYSGDWETAVQRAFRTDGVDVIVVRRGAPAAEQQDTAAVGRAIGEWRARTHFALPPGIADRFEWDEDPAKPYWTEKPDWDAYTALLVWAAHVEHPESPVPARLTADWQTDPAIRASCADDADSSFRNLLWGAEIWLPVRLAMPCEMPDPGGNPRVFGSSGALFDELRAVNAATWRAAPPLIDEWRHAGVEAGAPLELLARFGLAVFLGAAEFSLAQRVPIVMDY